MLQPYNAGRKTLKWYRKLVIHLVQVAMLNSYVMYTKEEDRDKTFVKFQQEVFDTLFFIVSNFLMR